jgi:hypothetical protein
LLTQCACDLQTPFGTSTEACICLHRLCGQDLITEHYLRLFISVSLQTHSHSLHILISTRLHYNHVVHSPAQQLTLSSKNVITSLQQLLLPPPPWLQQSQHRLVGRPSCRPEKDRCKQQQQWYTLLSACPGGQPTAMLLEQQQTGDACRNLSSCRSHYITSA